MSRSKGKDSYADFEPEKGTPSQKAVKAGLELIESGYTHDDTLRVASQLDAWVDKGTVKLSQTDCKRCAATTAAHREGRKAGFQAFQDLNAPVKPLE